MSTAARDWAWTVDGITMAERVILLYLAERCHRTGIAWPRLDTIATDCHADRATVWRAIKALSEKGHITDEGPGPTPGNGNVDHRYRLHVQPVVLQIATDDEAPMLQDATERVAGRDRARRELQQNTLQDATLLIRIEPSLEPLLKPTVKPSSVVAEPQPPKRVRAPRVKPDSEITETTRVLRVIQEYQGYPFEKTVTQNVAIKKMLERGDTFDQIIGCWETMKTQPFWADKPIPMANVSAQMGEYKLGNLKPYQGAQRNGRSTFVQRTAAAVGSYTPTAEERAYNEDRERARQQRSGAVAGPHPEAN